ncbi:MAG: class I SAM-dependent methyltransferase [Phycisphaerales bacterium]|nr:class I SAM-dependent methyltransferase [Phycisphaerales bacterium]
MSKPIQHPRERLTGTLVLDAAGQVSEPGQASPFPKQLGVPTMLSDRELDYLHWLGGTVPSNGQVVELGSFLGGSTAALVEGMRGSGRSHQPVIVYDGFVAPASEECVTSWWMKPFGLKAGENFRTRYESLHASRLDRLVIREGWLPEDAEADEQRRLYPEQRPIDVLFVDAAKTWGVHRTILRAFARFMKPGSVLVQQDFLDFPGPWLPIHMWQLRDVFRPLDLVRSSPSLAFECIGDPARRVDQAWDFDRFFDRELREDVWLRVRSYWSGLIGPAAGFLHAHEARHAFLVGDHDAITAPARRFEAWSNSRDSQGVYVAPGWLEALQEMAKQAEKRRAAHSGRLRDLAAEAEVRASLPRNAHRCGVPPEARAEYWSVLVGRLRDAGIRSIALYGAGAHTRWLLDHRELLSGVRIECVLDDRPSVAQISGVPVRDPSNVSLPADVAVVPSSDAFEAEIVRRATERFESRNAVFRVYTFPRPVSREGPVRAAAGHSQPEAPHRAELGLQVQRGWLPVFQERLVLPGWAKGCTSPRDLMVLWDMVEAVRPDCILEIGTASGVSSLMLAAATDHFGGTSREQGRVYSFDIAESCYFDRSRLIGSAAMEASPRLSGLIEFYPGRTAIDAARRFGVGQVDLAFIDGDHRHPAPTLDLLALLYAVRPGGWVVLHDIELTAASQVHRRAGTLEWDIATGAETLFRRWPFQKVQPRNAGAWENNIGAIRLPMNPGDAVAFLLEHLRLPWETGETVPAVRASLRATAA